MMIFVDNEFIFFVGLVFFFYLLWKFGFRRNVVVISLCLVFVKIDVEVMGIFFKDKRI